MNDMLIDSELLNELRNSKVYVRGYTNIDEKHGCNMQSRWGPAKDVTYFLYDQEPYEQEVDSRKRRMKRKYDANRNDREVEYQDRGEEIDDEEESNFDDGEENDSAESKVLAGNKRAASSKFVKKGKQRTKRKHEWQSWGPWGTCSATCGKGVRSRWRRCVSPTCKKGEKEADVKECIRVPCKK